MNLVIRHVLEGKEMEDSSDTDEESEDEVANSQTRDKKEELEEGDGEGDERSSEEREGAEELSVVNSDPSAATSLKKSHRIKFRDEEAVKKVVLADKRGEKVKEKKDGSVQKEEEKEEKDKGKTLMELLELEMRARAIKALLMKAGKEEGEAETLAIEEALDEAKKKEKEVKNAAKESKKADDAVAETVAAAEAPADEVEEDDDDEEPPEKVYNSNNSIMSKARDALMLSESKKLIADQVKSLVKFGVKSQL